MSRYKLVVNVPMTHADAVRQAIGDAGGGRVDKYSHCSFSIRGTGRFTPQAGANPHIGRIGLPETVEEEQIQADVMKEDMKSVLAAMIAAHPYEEIGYEIYPVLSGDDF